MALNFINHNPWIFAFGLLGNIFSFIVFLAPVPTFIRVYKKKSTEEFQSIPYVVALFSAMLLIYYASLHSDELFLITINSFGCVIETIYIAMFVAYAPKKARIFTLRFLLLLDVGAFCLILLITQLLVKREYRAKVIGFMCGGLSVSVFAAPLSIMRTVIRTKSVEYMPFSLSFFLTISAVMWLLYGLMLKDFYVALPNTLGFAFGMAQMILYLIYRKSTPVAVKAKEQDEKLPQHKADIIISTTADDPSPPPPPPPPSNSEPAAAAAANKYCSMDMEIPNMNQPTPLMVRCEA